MFTPREAPDAIVAALPIASADEEDREDRVRGGTAEAVDAATTAREERGFTTVAMVVVVEAVGVAPADAAVAPAVGSVEAVDDGCRPVG